MLQYVPNARINVKRENPRETHMPFVHTARKSNGKSYDMDAASRLRRARILAGHDSAREAARKHGWSYNSYAQHESGLRGINRVADKYARAFRVSKGWLLTGEGPGPDSSKKSIDKKLQILPQEDYDYIFRAVDSFVDSLVSDRLDKQKGNNQS